MCETCKLLKEFIESWWDVVEQFKNNDNIIPFKTEHFIEFIYNSVTDDNEGIAI